MAEDAPGRSAVYLVRASDPSLVSQALDRLLEEFASERLAGALEEHGPVARDEALPIAAVLDACRTPPFLADSRLVVLRSTRELRGDEAAALVGYLKAPLETTVLILAVAGGVPAALVKAVRSCGTVIDAEPGTRARDREAWVAAQLDGASIHLDPAATRHLLQHLGEDLARLAPLLRSLESSYGPGARIGLEELEPYVGQAGGVPPWDLTDAIDRGEIEPALIALRRMLTSGERHPLQVMASLHRHFSAMLALDGVEGLDEQGAAKITGLSPFPAKKALTQARRLGRDRLGRAINLLANADLDLRGRLAWPPELVMEVLVARLAQLARTGSSAARRRS